MKELDLSGNEPRALLPAKPSALAVGLLLAAAAALMPCGWVLIGTPGSATN